MEDELDQVALEWNCHRIRSTKNHRAPIGKPIMMYQVPILYDAENALISIPQDVISCLEEECTFHSTPCNEDMNILCREVISENNFNSQCEDPYDAVQLYLNLREKNL
ncbi:hypothetical protein NQ314_003424 [Rhamnusium bicolor]|uniref:Uncharacterized protein n=1 Tax=Rhamnusium bicolor TaxID=1586634 RepID=A0AAV8ZP90_9CUCU|nr:hypothetical protein NQ314_003424 [Rhamnusium bicolor]